MLQKIEGLQHKENLSYVCNSKIYLGKHDRHEWLVNRLSNYALSFLWPSNVHRRKRTRRNAIACITYVLDSAALLH